MHQQAQDARKTRFAVSVEWALFLSRTRQRAIDVLQGKQVIRQVQPVLMYASRANQAHGPCLDFLLVVNALWGHTILTVVIRLHALIVPQDDTMTKKVLLLAIFALEGVSRHQRVPQTVIRVM